MSKSRQIRVLMSLLLCVVAAASAQKESVPEKQDKFLTVSCGICDSNGLFLPKPKYPEAARAVGLSGKVVVRILVDVDGSVRSASVDSGHIFFHRAVLKAARASKFQPLLIGGKLVRVNSTIVYNFLLEPNVDLDDTALEIVPGSIKVSRCESCTDLIIELPDVEYPKYVGYGAHKYEGEVGVQIVIDEQGNVESAKGVFGHPYFRPMLEKASLTAKFKPTIVEGVPVKKTAVIVYKIVPPGPDEQGSNRQALDIINAQAIKLPKPIYTDEMKNLCATGEVEIEVELNEDGTVHDARAISGDELLYEASIAAVKKARFQTFQGPPVRSRGIVVYNFPERIKCIDVGNVQGKWIKEPKFSIHPHSIVLDDIEIKIRVGIDPLTGEVLAAKILVGHPLNKLSLEKEALRMKFSPTFINSRPFIVKGFIQLRVKPDRPVQIVP